MQSAAHLFAQRLFCLALRHDVVVDVAEVALLEALDGVALAEQGLEFRPKVVQKRLFLLRHVVRLEHRRVHRRHLLLLGREVHGHTVVLDLDAVGLVLGGEEDAAVLE